MAQKLVDVRGLIALLSPTDACVRLVSCTAGSLGRRGRVAPCLLPRAATRRNRIISIVACDWWPGLIFGGRRGQQRPHIAESHHRNLHVGPTSSFGLPCRPACFTFCYLLGDWEGGFGRCTSGNRVRGKRRCVIHRAPINWPFSAPKIAPNRPKSP